MIYRSKDPLYKIRITDSNVVLTSYREVMKSCPMDKKILGQLKETAEEFATAHLDWARENPEKGRFLHNYPWYRVRFL